HYLQTARKVFHEEFIYREIPFLFNWIFLKYMTKIKFTPIPPSEEDGNKSKCYCRLL
ncbi:MAG: hypothetical protein ACI85I_001965, partial [Arenicella sp.]